MPASLRRLLAWLGWALLWSAALAGVALSAGTLLATLPATRARVASALIQWAGRTVEGRLELDGIAVLARGGIQVRGFRVFDPEGRLVLRVETASLYPDVGGIVERTIGLSVELDGVDVDAALRSDDGTLALARAFAPSRSSVRRRRPPAEKPPGQRLDPGGGWTLRVDRLVVTNGRVRAEGAGAAPLSAVDLSLEAQGLWGPSEGLAEVRLSGRLEGPVSAPLSLELKAVRRGDRVELQRLTAGLGRDRLEAVGDGDLARRSGRLAVTQLALSKQDAGALAPAARISGDLVATLYAESDGEIATGALSMAAEGKGGGGRGEIAVAVRLPPGRLAWGAAADVDRFDPSRLSLFAPPGRVTLRGHGAARGTRLAEMTGRVDLRWAPSRIRGGELGPIELEATAGGGSIEVARLQAVAPGGSLGGQLHWREGKSVTGTLTLTASDLSMLGSNLGALLGQPLPALEGSGRAAIVLSGTSGAPRLEADVDAPRLAVGRVRADGARLRVELTGPAASFTGRVEGELLRATVGGLELRGVTLAAGLHEEEGSLSVTANVPELGPELVRVMLRGRFGPERRTFDLADLALAWPGTRFILEKPARFDLARPSVDRVVLAAEAQRIEAEGGLRADGTLDGRLRLVGIDLAGLPRGLAPPDLEPKGILTLDARLSGTRAAPRVEATLGLAAASFFEVAGLQLLGDVTWDGELERVEADLGLVRANGGTIDLSLDVPLALARARPNEEVRVELRCKAVPLDELVWLAGSYALLSGDVDLTANLSGTVGAPALRATAAVRNGAYEDLEELALDAVLDAPGDRLKLRVSGSLSGGSVGSVEGELALDLARLLSRPREALRALQRGPLALTLQLPGVALHPLAGRLALPADLAGRLDGEASLGGTLRAPRGTLWLALDQGAGWGARKVGGRLELALASARSGAKLELQLASQPAARVDGSVDLPAERLLERQALAGASFRAEAALPRSELSAWGGENVALAGTVEGRASAHGTLGAPQGELSLSASGATVEKRPLGDVTLDARYAAQRSSAVVELHPASGGSLHGELALERPLGIDAQAGPLRDSIAELKLRADRLDLGFLPAVAPGVVRVASGAATVDLAAAGPVGDLRPRGSFHVAGGRLALAEVGEWTDAVIDAELGDDTVELKRFDVHKGKGRLALRATLRGLARRGEAAEIEAKLDCKDFGIERAGMEFVRLELGAEARGKLTRDELTLGIVVPQADVRLPKRIPRTLQSPRGRDDITIGRPRSQRGQHPTRAAPVEPGAETAAARREPFRTVLHVVAPRRFRVRADQPRIDVELKADAIFAFAGSRDEASGSIEVIRGQVEPIGGRVFELERGKLTFTGGPIQLGGLDVVARYDNPTAVIRATVGGTIAKPQLQLVSQPPLQETQIAMLIATGRTEVNAGAGGVNSLAAGDAGLAAAGALAMGVFKDLLSDKLPVDSVSLDSTAVRAGKYLTDRIYVGYVRRFDAKPEKGENPDEVQFEYQLAPGWQVQTRYGSGQAGGASIVWTRSY
jgi:translocation and assembly module TamB